SPDGRRLATGTWDGEVRVWDASTPAAAAPADPARRQASAWLRAGIRSGPRSRFVRQMEELMDEALEEGEDVWLTCGAGQLRSGKAAQVVLFGGLFFVFELSTAQARQLGLEPTSTRLSRNRRLGQRRQKPLAELSDVRFDGSLDGGKPITGQVS